MSRKRDFTQNEKVQAKLREIDKHLELLRREDLKSVMALPAGRRFVYDLIFDRCDLMSSYSDTDIGVHRFEGRREVGFRLAREIQDSHPHLYVQMIKEHTEEQETINQLREAAHKQPAHDADEGEPQ